MSSIGILKSQPCFAAFLELLSVPALQLGMSAFGDSLLPLRTGAIPAFAHFLASNSTRHQARSSSSSSPPTLGPRGHLVKRKSDLTLPLRLITINIRTLYDSGKMKFFASQLKLLSADVVFVQETRISEKIDLQQLNGFQLFSTPALHGHGGLMVLVRSDPLLAVDRHRSISPRVMVVFMHVDSIPVRLICAHAPIAEAPSHDHESFAADMQVALQAHVPGELLFVGCDLNARLATVADDFQCVGQHASSSCPSNAEFRHSCLRHFDDSKLIAANTLTECPDPATWRHPSGTEHQIDFIMIPQLLHEQGRLTSIEVGPRAFFDCTTTSDHRHVFVTVVLTSSASRGKSKKLHARVRVADDKHVADFKAALPSSLPAWTREQPAAEYMQDAMATLVTTLKSTSPAAARPRKPWITNATWDRIKEFNKLRRLLVARRRHDDTAASSLFVALGSPHFGIWCDCGPACVCNYGARYDAALVSRIHEMKCLVRRLLRSDRRQWFDSACADAAEAGRANCSRLLHRTVKAICKTAEFRGSRLCNDSGEIVSDRVQVEHMWLRHWVSHFSAVTGPVYDFADRSTCTPPGCLNLDDRPPVPENFVISENDVLRAMREMPCWRATADPAPAVAVIAAAPFLAAPLAQLYNECLQTSTVPASYAGARLVPVWKKKGSAYDSASYRPIALMLLEAKVFARICLRKLMPLLHFHHSQYGSGRCCGVTFPQAYVQQIAAYAKAEHLSSATLFIDVQQAFDAVSSSYHMGDDTA
eukprot:6486683-Amphidinium_carterae.2